MAASGQAKRHQSNSDQGAHWGRHGKSLPHGVHGSPQLEARPGVSCILLDRAAHSSDFGNTRVGADPNALSPASDFTSADQKPVGPIRHQTRSNVSRRAAGSSASPVISVMEAVRRLSSRTTAPASRTHPNFPQLAPEMAGLGAQVGDVVVVLPDFNPGCPFQEGASRAQRSGVRTALDGVAGCDVVGRIELVKAVMAHAPKRSASASVAGIRLWRRRWGHARRER